MRNKYKIIIVFLIITIFFTFLNCSKSARKNRIKSNKENVNKKENKNSENIVKIRKKGGVYYIPAKVNGIEMDFIFDTGASDITLSAKKAKYLLEIGKLEEKDFIGTQQYITADGSICEGTLVILKTVTIGKKTLYNVQASIVNNLEAPLLLGQSALSRFGKIFIDYSNNLLIFE